MIKDFRAGCFALLLLAVGCQQAPSPLLSKYSQIDLLIENGNVIDGSGNAAFEADVAVVGDRIVLVGAANLLVDFVLCYLDLGSMVRVVAIRALATKFRPVDAAIAGRPYLADRGR